MLPRCFWAPTVHASWPIHRVTPRILGREGLLSLLSDLSDIMLFGSACVTVSNFEFVCYRVCYRPNFSRVWRPSLEFS